MSMVRAGLIIYGEYPSAYVKENTALKVAPAMEIKARISQIKEVPPDTGVSYGKTYHTKGRATLATVCVGYADSYSRSLSNRASVIVRGRLARQVGNVCMDQMLVDVTGIPGVESGGAVTLIGREGDASVTFSDIAGLLSTINYEIMCGVGKRVAKAYFEDGRLTEVVNYLDSY
jgi:alanine racemase